MTMMNENLEKLSTGATRTELSVRFDLLPPYALRQMAEVMHLGAKTHGDRNWEKGMPVSVCLNHASDHIYAYMADDKSCNHLAHAAVNLCMALHSLEVWPELNEDMPGKYEREAGK